MIFFVSINLVINFTFVFISAVKEVCNHLKLIRRKKKHFKFMQRRLRIQIAREEAL